MDVKQIETIIPSIIVEISKKVNKVIEENGLVRVEEKKQQEGVLPGCTVDLIMKTVLNLQNTMMQQGFRKEWDS